MNQDEIEIAQKNFWVRKDENKGKQINNSSLRAGSPMYFYCRHCGVHTETLPESYTGKAVTICRPCDELDKMGAVPTKRPEVNLEVTPEEPRKS